MALPNERNPLIDAWRSLSEAGGNDGWCVITVHSKRFRAGIRFPDKQEAILFGFNINNQKDLNLPQGNGFSVGHVETPLGEFSVWVAVTRNNQASIQMFTLMASDLITSVSVLKTEEHLIYRQLIARIVSWQQFMERPRRSRLTDEEETGLFSELTFLNKIIDNGISPTLAVDYWKGPANGIRDFISPNVDVEIKATVSRNNFTATISSLDQLDDFGTRCIYLVAYRFINDDGGETLSELINLIRKKIGENGSVPFERNLLLAGYEDISSDLYDRPYTLIDERLLIIDEEFPRIIRSKSPIAIKTAKYEIDINLVDAPEVECIDIVLALGGSAPQ